MAGLIHYIGKILTEKNGFFKVLTITLMCSVVASLEETFLKSLGAGHFAGASLVLTLLLLALTGGFSLQIYSNKMRNMPNVLPEFDLVGMFVATLKFIPFWLVWSLYLGLFGAVWALVLPSMGTPSTAVIIAFLLMLVVVLIIYGLSWPCLVAIHAKNFTYRNVLNIFAPVQIYSKVAGEMAKLIFKYMGLFIVLLAIFYGFAFVIGLSSALGSPETQVTDGVSGVNLQLLITMFIFASTLLQYAYILCVSEITLNRLSETKFLPESLEYVPEEKVVKEEDLEL